MAQDELIEQQIYDIEENIAPSQSMWPRYIYVVGIILAIAGIALTPIYLWAVVFMAYTNCILYTFFAIHFLKKGTLNSLIPVVAPLWMVVGSCLGVIYFATFFPFESYEAGGGYIGFLDGGVRYQMAIFIFMLVYFITMAWFLRKEKTLGQHPSKVSKYIGLLSLAIGAPILFLMAALKLVDLPPFLSEWTNRLFVYYQSVLFVTGIVINRLSKTIKIWLVVLLGSIALLYLLRGSRGQALVPAVSLLTAILFFSEVKTRTKLILVASLLIIIPWYMILGTAVRSLLGPGAAHSQTLGERWSAIKEWKSVATGKPVFGELFGRTFFTAGNLIVAYTPSEYPYRQFSLGKYIKEFAIYMMPEPLIRRVIKLDPGRLSIVLNTEYTGTTVLLEYGIFISEETSVEVSTIGNFWMLGGYKAVFIGGFLVALLHGIVACGIRRAWLKNPDKGAFYFGVQFFLFLYAMNYDFIYMCRSTLMLFIFAFVGYKLISPLLQNSYARMAAARQEKMLYSEDAQEDAQ